MAQDVNVSGVGSGILDGVSIEQIQVRLPDGSVREVARGTTPFEIANGISPRLAASSFFIRGGLGGGAGMEGPPARRVNPLANGLTRPISVSGQL